MKKVLYLISLLSLVITPNLASAHFSGEVDPGNCSVGIRTEVSKDNGGTWYSYDSSDAEAQGTGYTLQVARGDNIKIRVKIWNEGRALCNFSAQPTVAGLDYLESTSFDNYDEDGNDSDLLVLGMSDEIAGYILADGSATSGYESAVIDTTVKTDAPDNAAIVLNYNVGSVNLFVSYSGSTLAQKIKDLLVPTAHADGDGTATSGLRMEVTTASTPAVTVQELPKTGPSAYLFLIPIAFILPAYVLIKRKFASKSSR